MSKRRADYHPAKGTPKHQIVSALDPLTRKGWGGSTIFGDWVLAADAFAHLLRGRMLTVAQRYGDEAYPACGAALAVLVAALNTDPSHDVLGPLHMQWGNPNEHSGQFFTPMSIALLMAHMTLIDINQVLAARIQAGLDACPDAAVAFAATGLELAQLATWSDAAAARFAQEVLLLAAPQIEPIRSLEPCCGAGAMILAQIAIIPRWAVRVGLVQFVAIDLDPLCVAMTRLQATILGAHITCIQADALTWDGTLADGRDNPLAGTIPETLRRLYATAAHASANWDTARVAQVISVINAGRAGDNEPAQTFLAEEEVCGVAA